MPLGYHNQYDDKSGGTPQYGDTPGTVARRAQVRAATSERAQFVAESGSPITGNVSTRRDLDRAEAGLNRQLRTQQGKPLYKNGKFVGNQAP